MKKGSKILLLSMLALCISTVLTVGAVYALFTGSATVNNHLKAGKLEVGLERIGYEEYVLADDGLMTKNVDGKVVDLVANAEPVFAVENAVPTGWYKAELKVTNKGTVAFDYELKMLWNTDNKADEKQKLLAEQLQVTVLDADAKPLKTFKLSESATNAVPLGSMLKGAEPATVTVLVEFVNDENHTENNKVMEAQVTFDVQISATQRTEQKQAN